MNIEKHETYSEITAELRELSEGAVYCELQPKVFGKTISLYFAELADRIDAAVKRDRESRHQVEIPVKIVPTCSAARAQWRLSVLRSRMSNLAESVECGEKVSFDPRAVVDEIDDTLATKPRNCDVFADALWDTICRAWEDWLLTPEFNKRKIGGMKDFCYWFLGPAEKGVTK